MRACPCAWGLTLLVCAACRGNTVSAGSGSESAILRSPSGGAAATGEPAPAAPSGGASPRARLPLLLVADVELPGRATRFDYQDIDPSLGHLVLSHMNDGEVLFLRLSDGFVLARLTGIPVARGVAVASEIGRVFVTSSPHTLVLIDSVTMKETSRETTGNGPDGVAWDPTDQVVGVSDQSDGALSLLPDGGTGVRRALKLGSETGNVVFDRARGWFWISVVGGATVDQLVSVQPRLGRVEKTLALPGCQGAHGVRLHPNGQSAFVACEANQRLLQVDLETSRVLAALATGKAPDVLSIDPGLAWLYVAAESGDLSVFDLSHPVATLLGHDQPGAHSHSVAADATSHRVFFPLKSGPNARPTLRIMRPTGT